MMNVVMEADQPNRRRPVRMIRNAGTALPGLVPVPVSTWRMPGAVR